MAATGGSEMVRVRVERTCPTGMNFGQRQTRIMEVRRDSELPAGATPVDPETPLTGWEPLPSAAPAEE